jgi:hypothetical protein
MANLRLSDKTKKAALQRGIHTRDRLLDIKAKPPTPKKRRARMDPKERSWAHAYLKHAAEVKGLPFIGVRESMQMMGRYFDVEIPDDKGAGRSQLAIDLANAIQAKTGIRLPAQR